MKPHLVSEMIQARALIGFTDLVRLQGADPDDLLRTVGIPPEALDNPDLAIPLDRLATLYHRSALALSMPDFGLRLSSCQDTSIYGPLAQVLLNAATVGEALQGLTRYFAFHTPGAEIESSPATDERYAQAQYRLILGEGVEARQIIEQSYGMASKLWHLIEPPGTAPIRILLRHKPGVDVAIYEAHYGCTTLFEQPVDAIWLPRAAMTARMNRADPRLLDVSARYVASIIRRFPLNLGKQVEKLIIEQMPFGGASIEHITAQLGMHKRTLQRRLADQGILFGDLLDALRQSQARRYLGDTAVPLSMVTGLLGYNEQSSFIRACRRWFSLTPLEFRRRGMSSSPAVASQ